MTDLLAAWTAGRPSASERLFEAVYPELRGIARQCLGHSGTAAIQPTELANEAYLRLAAQRRPQLESRAHFFALFATHLRRALVDLARRRNRLKRGGGTLRVTLDHLQLPFRARHTDLLDLDRALRRLAEIAPIAALVVELRFFTGLSIDETAEALELGRTTVKRKWRFSRAWLARALGGRA